MMDWKYRDRLDTPRLSELISEHGKAWLLEGANIDDKTADMLIDYFLMSRINTHLHDEFQWFFRRNINSWYPVYKQQIEMWAELMAKGWYFDNEKTTKKVHKGTANEQIEGLNETVRKLKRIIEDILNSSTDTNLSDKATSRTTSERSTQGGDTSTDTTNSKDRAFSFRFPESNYTGGNIPYDLDNNPSVEFINSQGDTNRRSTVQHVGEYDEDQQATENGNSTDDWEQSTIRDDKRDNNQNDDETTTVTTGQSKDSQNEYEETSDFDGDPLYLIAEKWVELLPTTNYFQQFMDNMSKCFNNFYYEDGDNGRTWGWGFWI